MRHLTASWAALAANDTLADRNEAHALAQPGWADLRARLLRIGGEEVVSHYYGPEPEIEPDLDRILARGVKTSGATSFIHRMRPINCHGNASELWKTQGNPIATGYALSRDGLWRQHSWSIHADTGRLIETTEPREWYYGFTMTPEECDRFAKANPT